MIFGWIDRWLKRRASERRRESDERHRWAGIRAEKAEETRIERERAGEVAMAAAFAPLPQHIRDEIQLRVGLKAYGWGNIDNGQSPRARFLEECADIARLMHP